MPPTVPPCLAEDRPLVPSVPSMSPSRRSRRGESARERMEMEQVGGQLWPGPPPRTLPILTPCCRHRLAPGTPGAGQERVLQQRGRRGPLGRVGLEAAKDETLGHVRHGLRHLRVHLEHAHLEERPKRGCKGTGRPGWGLFGGGDPPMPCPSREYLEHCRLGAAQLVEGGLARGHLDDGAAQGPDIRRLPVAPRPLVDDFGGHVLQGAWREGGEGGKGPGSLTQTAPGQFPHCWVRDPNISSSSAPQRGGPGPQPLPVKVSALGLMPASLLEVPKSEIFSTPLYVLMRTLSPWHGKSPPKINKTAPK